MWQTGCPCFAERFGITLQQIIIHPLIYMQILERMDLDISSLWSWTLPLWGLFVIVLFLGGVLREPMILTVPGLAADVAKGGGFHKVRGSH